MPLRLNKKQTAKTRRGKEKKGKALMWEVYDRKDDELSKEVVDSIFTVHKTLGAGLLESAYEACLLEELKYRNLQFVSQFPVSLNYRGKEIGVGYRLDMLVEDRIIIEVKASEKLIPLYEAQLLTYLKLMDKRLGFLVNFNTPLIKDGIKRMVRRI